MADSLGLSFMPGGSDAQGSGGDQNNYRKPSPVQQAIQTLSLKIPRTVGAAGSLAPAALLNSQGGGMFGNVNDAMTLERIRQMLFGNTVAPAGRFGTPASRAVMNPGGGVSAVPSTVLPPHVLPGDRQPATTNPNPTPDPTPAPAPSPMPAPRTGFMDGGGSFNRGDRGL